MSKCLQSPGGDTGDTQGATGVVVKAVSAVRGARIALEGILLCAGWAEEPAEQAVVGLLSLAQPDPLSLL